MTRDSQSWWILLAVSVVGYLITAQVPPWSWTYMQWLQFAAAVLAWLSGFLKASPLDISKDGRKAYLSGGGK